MIRLRSLRSAATALAALALASSVAVAAVALHDLTGTPWSAPRRCCWSPVSVRMILRV